MNPTVSNSGRGNDRACEHCAAFFIARRSDQRFCSDRCRLRHWRLRKSASDAVPEERSSVAPPTQKIREILLGLIGADPRTAVAEELRTAFAELNELDREILRLRRRNDQRRPGDRAAGTPPRDRDSGC
ncbi:MAG: hypothetical protein HOV67_22080 [Kribbellaceae bacterium]|nr:hypothetical protein [Kribbellaceae bacterium]